MKIVKLDCPVHGEKETFARSDKQWGDLIPCPVDQCVNMGPYIPGRVNTDPEDQFKHGIVSDYGYVTSRQEYESRMKAKGHRYAEKGDEREISRAAKYHEEKQNQQIHNIMVESYKQWKSKR